MRSLNSFTVRMCDSEEALLELHESAVHALIIFDMNENQRLQWLQLCVTDKSPIYQGNATQSRTMEEQHRIH